MSMRISDRASALLLLALAGCSSGETPSGEAIPAADADRIPCARGNAPLEPNCTVERMVDGEGLVLTVRHGDGGFHRLRVINDGRGVVAADGAEPARVTVVGADGIDVSIGQDRYRLPATIKGA